MAPPSEIALPDRTVWLHRECEVAWMKKNPATIRRGVTDHKDISE